MGRPAYDVVLMFKILVLQRLYDLSDAQMEYQVKDRLTFMRFLGFDFLTDVPDEKTIWNFREKLKQKGLARKLFQRFNRLLEEHGYISKPGKIIDASIVEVPQQRNTREENAQIREGEVPAQWGKNPNMLAQKDTDARWLKRNGETYYGYKNHVRIDSKTKLVEEYAVTPANIHDSQAARDLLTKLPQGPQFTLTRPMMFQKFVPCWSAGAV